MNFTETFPLLLFEIGQIELFLINKIPTIVIPAEAGIHFLGRVDSRLRGNDAIRFFTKEQL